MRMMFAGGGTAGHVNPIIAIAKAAINMRPDTEVMFVGCVGGIEQKLVAAEGFDIETFEMRGFKRSMSPAAILYNLNVLKNAGAAERKASEIIRRFKPDVVLGSGGYASYPAVRAAQRLGIKTAVLEVNALPGIATKTLAKKADRILLAYKECVDVFDNKDKCVVTGTPLRMEMLSIDRDEARVKLGVGSRPLVVSFWGSIGGKFVNEMTASLIALESTDHSYKHIHATGSAGYKWMPELIASKGVNLENCPHIELREYIYDMPVVMAAADIVMCRGGSTLAEIAAMGKPSIIVPSPYVAENHQEKNAMVFKDKRAAEVILESECSGELMYNTIRRMLADKQRMDDMAYRAALLAKPDATAKICEILFSLPQSDKK